MKPRLSCDAVVRQMAIAAVLTFLCTTALADEAQPDKPAVQSEPAVAYVIEEMTARGAPLDGALHLQASIDLKALTDGETYVPLFSGKVAVLSYSVRGGGIFARKAMVVRRDGEVGVVVRSGGAYHVELELASKIAVDGDRRTALLPMVRALASRAEVELPGQDLEVTVTPADTPYEIRSTPGRTLLIVYGALEGPVSFSYRPVEPPRVVEPVVFADVASAIGITPGALSAETSVVYSLLQGEIQEAAVSFPADCTLLQVTGENIRDWETAESPEERLTLKVRFRRAVKDSVRVGFRLQKVLESTEDGVFELPRIAAENVLREKGALAVSSRKDLQVELVEHSGVYQVGAAELPAELALTAELVDFGLLYLKQPYDVTVRVAEVKPRVSAEVFSVAGIALDRIRQSWLISYEVRDAGLFQLQVQLDEGMKLVDLRGEHVTNETIEKDTNILTVDLRSSVMGTYELELHTESVLEQPGGFEIPRLEPLGAERHRGMIAVSTSGREAVEVVGEPSGISQIDTAETGKIAAIQGFTESLGLQPAALAFRYLSYPYALSLSVGPVEPEVRVEPLHLVEITRKSLTYTSTFAYRIKKASIFQVQFHLPPALRPGLQVEGDKIEDFSYDAVKEMLTVQLTEGAKETLTLRLTTEKMLDDKLPEPGDTGLLELPPIYCEGVEQERGYLLLSTEESVRLKRSVERAEQLHDVDVLEVPPTLLQQTGSPKLAFRIVGSPWALSVEVESILPEIAVQIFNYVRFGENLLIGASTVEFKIKHAGVDEFMVRLPKGISDPNISGANIKVQEKVKETEEGEGDLWRIELQSEAKDTYSLIFEYTMTLDPEQKERVFSGPRVMDEMPQVQRETGFVAVTADPSLELTPLADKIKDLSPVDEEQIPLKFRVLPESIGRQIGRATVPILFAFRYLAQPYTLALSSVRHTESEVVTAVVESCKLITTVTEEGSRLTTLLADVRSRYEHFLSLRLPEGVDIWHAAVNGRRVRPLEESSDAGKITKIPIAQVQGIERPVRVELQWGAQSKKLGKLSRMELTAPDLGGVRILRLGWILQMPEGYSIVSDSGVLKRVPSSGYFEPRLRELAASGQSAAVSQTVSSKGQAEQQQMNANVMVLTGRRSEEKIADWGAQTATAQPELPSKFYFQGLILDPALPASVSAVYMESSVTLPLAVLEVLLCAALVALFWFRVRLSPAPKLAVLIVVVLIVGGVRLVVDRHFPFFLTTAAWSLGASTVLFVLLSGARRLSGRWGRSGDTTFNS